MRSRARLGVVVLVLATCGFSSAEPGPGVAPVPERPGDAERAAMARVDFLVGDWQGEGWSLTPAGERSRFWVEEFYHYRGDTDLMDMEGRFGDIQPDGTHGPQHEFGLGFLYYDRTTGEYHMWHYSSDGSVFTVPMEVDVEARTMQYTRTSARGTTYTFALVVGADGVWVSRITVQQPDGSWKQMAEFQMQRTGRPA